MKNKKKHSQMDENELTDTQAEVMENPDESTEATPQVDPKDEQITQLESDLLLAKTELEVAKDTLLRRTAEFENVKKRMMRERMQLIDDAKIEALKAFLPINDDLQRTLGATKGQEIPAAFLEGVTLVADKFGSILSNYGVETIAEAGIPFDVNLHDALMRIPAPEKGMESNTVVQVLEPGYKLGEKIIRHAKVIVSE
jgi:molecular chaperone GrpE